ncbi:MAG TPA: hypothetical protein VN445_03010 [Rectinemataceae bacterium]|nr:hypothetical protein [Rectinemataceae bacterium]
MIRSRIAEPLHIDEVGIPHGSGIVGMTSCPGKKHRSTARGTWDGDLASDLATIRAWGAEILVSLIEPRECEARDIEGARASMPGAFLRLQLPIPDGSTPDAAWESSWEREAPAIRSVLRRGGRVCVHCMGGLGRTGLVAARLLVEFGMRPEEAILAVRGARPGSIETAAQEEYVRALLPIRGKALWSP